MSKNNARYAQFAMALAEGNATLETAVIQSEQGHTAKHCHK